MSILAHQAASKSSSTRPGISRPGLLFLTFAFIFFAPSSAMAAKRVALVIGNSAYKNVLKLPNPANDAAAIATLLKASGFEVVEHKNDLDYSAMRRALRNFTETAQDADIAVVYYAGHGIEVKGTNYLIPTDAVLERDIDIEDEAVSLDRLVNALESVKALRLIILDACRDNPFAKTMKRTVASRSLGRGLAEIEPGFSNTLIAFAAKAGSTASDGSEKNSPFTSALLKNIAVPGLDIRLALGIVRDDVVTKTNRKQEPFVYGSLGGGTVSLVPVAPQRVTPAPSAAPSVENILRDYQLARDINTAEAWESFMAAHPSSGFYFNLAKAARDKAAADEKSRSGSESSRRAADEEARRKAAEEAEMRAAEETKKKAEAEARRKAEQEAKAEAEAKRLAEAKMKAEAEAKRLADAKLKAEAEARLKVEADAKRKAELEAKAQAEAEARRVAELKEKAEAETKRKQAEAESRSKTVERQADSEPRSVIALVTPQRANDPPKSSETPGFDMRDISGLLQYHLKRVGCDPGTFDGTWNETSGRALAQFNKHANTNFDLRTASLEALENVKKYQGRACPLVCAKGFQVEQDRCVAINCGRGRVLAKDGECVAEARVARQPVSSSGGKDTPDRVVCGIGGCKTVGKNCRAVSVATPGGMGLGRSEEVVCN